MKKAVIGIIIGAILVFAIDVVAGVVISSSSVSYSNTTVNAALDDLFSSVDINQRLGTTSISGIGNGTITGAISTLNSNVSGMKVHNKIYSVTLSANQYVSPYSHFGSYVIPASDLSTYGSPIAVYATHSDAQPMPVYVTGHASGGYAVYISGIEAGVTLSAYFVKLNG